MLQKPTSHYDRPAAPQIFTTPLATTVAPSPGPPPHMQDPYLGTRQRTKKGWGAYTWQTYAQCAQRRTAIGSGLLALGIEPNSFVGLFGINSAEWMLVDLAIHAYSMVAVPLYDTLGPDVVQYICSHAELVAVACAASQLPTLMKRLPECPTVRLIVRPPTLPPCCPLQRRDSGWCPVLSSCLCSVPALQCHCQLPPSHAL
jgi:acyl-CoA synthetase (AMP-forming)/AMP-acid ligase II